MYAAHLAAEEPDTPETTPACVDCAGEGTEHLLTAVYTVSGTVLCREHAVQERERQRAAAR